MTPPLTAFAKNAFPGRRGNLVQPSKEKTPIMKLSHILAATLAVVGAVAIQVPAAQAIVVDQFQLDGSEQNFGIHSDSTSGQSFTMGVSGRIDALELTLDARGSVADLLVSLIDMSGGDFLAAPELATVSLGGAGLGPFSSPLDLGTVTATLIDFSSFDVQVAAGDVLGFKLASDVILPEAFVIGVSLSNPYADGVFFSNGAVTVPDRDAAFKVFVTRNVPEPGALGLLLLGGVTLLGMRRRRLACR